MELSKHSFCGFFFFFYPGDLPHELHAVRPAALLDERGARSRQGGDGHCARRTPQRDRFGKVLGVRWGRGGEGRSQLNTVFLPFFPLFSNSSLPLIHPAHPLRPVMTISKCYFFFLSLFFQCNSTTCTQIHPQFRNSAKSWNLKELNSILTELTIQ